SLAVAARIKAKLDQASEKLDNRQYSESRTILKELDKENLKPEDALRRDTLQALVLVRDAKNAVDRSQGAQLCFDLLEKGGSSREKDRCIALADVADAQGEYLGRAVGTLKSVKDRLTDKDRVGVEKRYGALAVRHFDLLEDQAYRQLGNAAEFAKLINQ